MTYDPSNPNQPPSEPSAQPIRARVPDSGANGCFTTGAIVVTGPSEFVIDFLQTIGRPQRVTARVIVPHAVMPQFIDALIQNIELYQGRFGPLVTPNVPPKDPNARQTSLQEIYDDLKIADEVLSGTYANGVMISHGASEFALDFLTSFFPQSAVSARVFVAAGQVPRLLDSLKNAVRQLQQRHQGGNPLPPADPTQTQTDAESAPSDDSPLGDDQQRDENPPAPESNDDTPPKDND